MSQFVEVQSLAGNRVRDVADRVVGRIESIRAERIGPHCVVHEYHLGAAALLSRLGISALHLFGARTNRKPLRVPWQQLDLSDPLKPCLRCTRQELEAMQSQLPPFEDESPPKREMPKEEE